MPDQKSKRIQFATDFDESEPQQTHSPELEVLTEADARVALQDEDEDQVQQLGDFARFGRYTLFIILLYELMILPQMTNMTFMIYGGFAPRVLRCGEHDLSNLSTVQGCAALRVVRNGSECEPELGAQFQSLAFEYNYYCERMVEVKKSISVLMFGVLCGAVLFGQLSDSFGRKRMMLCTLLGMFAFDLCVSRTQTLRQFTLVQFVTCLFVGGHNTILHVFLLENVPKKHRVWLSCTLSYSPNYVIVAGIAYWAQDWRTLIRIAGFLNVPAFILLLMAYESPRWLIQQAMLDSARTILMKMERINGTATPKRLRNIDRLIAQEVRLNEEKKSKRKYYFYHLFYTWRMCVYTAVISYGLLVTSVVAYALVFNLEHLSGSIYVSTALFGLFRYALNLLVGYVDYFVAAAGRRPVHQGALAVVLGLLALVVALQAAAADARRPLRAATMAAAAVCSQLFMVNTILTSELFPTAIRNLAVGFMQIAGRLGGVLSPHMFYLAYYWEPLPFLVMFVMMATNMFFFGICIPETKHSAMVDHMPDKSKRLWKPRKTSMQTNIQPSVAKLAEDV